MSFETVVVATMMLCYVFVDLKVQILLDLCMGNDVVLVDLVYNALVSLNFDLNIFFS